MMAARIMNVLLLWLILPAIALGDGLTYRSDRLGRMGGLLGEDSLAALPDGEHTAVLTFIGSPVTVIKANGVIEHIGYSFFPPRNAVRPTRSCAVFWRGTPLRPTSR